MSFSLQIQQKTWVKLSLCFYDIVPQLDFLNILLWEGET